MGRLEDIIKKLGFDPLKGRENEDYEPKGMIDDSYNPYDVLTDEEMHYLTMETLRRAGKLR